MKLVARGRWRREVVATLCHPGVPESVRAAVLLGRVSIVVVGGGTHGWCIEGTRFDGAEHLIALAGRDGLPASLAHELGHATGVHRGGTKEAEIEAASAARAWGFNGSSADPDLHAEAFKPEPEPTPRAAVTDDAVRIQCATCGHHCDVWSLVVRDLNPQIAAECDRCGWFLLATSLATLVPCSGCGEITLGVKWTEDATPAHAVAEWACTCGATATRVIRSAEPELVVPREAEPAWRFYARSAARVLSLDNGDPAWARSRLRRALAEMDGDPRRASVEAAMGLLQRLDVAGALAALAAVEQRP